MDRKINEPPEPAARRSPHDPGPQAKLPGHILVVTRDADTRELMIRLLAPHWRVDAVDDAAQAMAFTEARMVDLILIDVSRPDPDGRGLVRALRAYPGTPAIPVIMIADPAGVQGNISDIQADDYLAKPFSELELLTRVQAHLALAMGARERARSAERERSTRREAALERDHLISLLMQTPMPVCLLRGPDHRIELLNAPGCEVFGRSHDQLVGRPLFEAVPELRGQVFEQLLRDVLRTGQPYFAAQTPCKLDRQGTGVLEEVFFTFGYAPLEDGDGVDGILVVATDVTTEVKAREQMRGLVAAAEVASRAKDEFLAMVSHELRNPLAPLQTALDLLRERLTGTSSERLLDVAARQAKQLGRIVDDLTDVARISQGKVELRREVVDLGASVTGALDTLRDVIGERRHEVSVSLPKTPLNISADPVRLDQVILNLLTNAAKYTEPGGHIWVSLDRSDGMAELRIRDSGIGIAPQLLPHIFELFQQGQRDLARKQGGLGIGLTIVRRLVDLHGGTVSATSAGSGQGSEFIVRLPTIVAAGDRPRPTPTENPILPFGRRKVLVVDDNEDAAEVLAEVIEGLGHDARLALDGPSALKLADDWHPDVVFLDLGLPGMDGYEVARELRVRDDHALLIALTGYGRDQDRARTREAGFHRHLVKPAGLDAIAAVLTEAA